MKELLQLILISLKKDKKINRYPEHISAQALRVVIKAGKLAYNADMVKYPTSDESMHRNLKLARQSAIETASQAIRFVERLDKDYPILKK